MKKIFIVALGLVGIFTNAQQKEGKSQIGVNTTLNVSSLWSDDAKPSDYSINWAAGVYYSIPLSQSFAIQPELAYSRLGGKFKNSGENNEAISNTVTLDYIQARVLAKYYIAGSKFNVAVGPQGGVNLYASNKEVTRTGENGQFVTNTEKTNIYKNVERMDFGFVGGFGYDITNHLNANVRYYVGILDTFKKDSNYSGFNNQNFSLSVGYSF